MSKKSVLFIAALGYVAWYFYKNKDNNLTTVENISADLQGFVPVTFRLNNAKSVSDNLLNNSNIKAFLQVIRKGEGTLGDIGYKTIFGGQKFNSFNDHPRIVVKKGRYTSSAAGAYQFLSSTWDETARLMGLKDFSPKSQDLAAVGRIAIRGALQDVIEGRFEMAVKKTAKEWASLPYSPYGQPTQTIAAARQFYIANNGIETV